MQFSSIWPIDRTLSGATSSSESEPGNGGNKGVLSILQSSGITGAWPSDCLVSLVGGVLLFRRDAIGVFSSPIPLGHTFEWYIYIYIYILKDSGREIGGMIKKSIWKCIEIKNHKLQRVILFVEMFADVLRFGF